MGQIRDYAGGHGGGGLRAAASAAARPSHDGIRVCCCPERGRACESWGRGRHSGVAGEEQRCAWHRRAWRARQWTPWACWLALARAEKARAALDHVLLAIPVSRVVPSRVVPSRMRTREQVEQAPEASGGARLPAPLRSVCPQHTHRHTALAAGGAAVSVQRGGTDWTRRQKRVQRV